MADDTDILIVLVLDKSGSMESCRDATISGYNEFKQSQADEGKRLASSTLMSLTLFDTSVEQRHVAVDIATIPDFDRDTYVPGGLTALYDAVGNSIRTVEAQKNLPSKVLFVIQTDGGENASREWTQTKIFDLISKKRNDGWDFVFLGADQDAYEQGGHMGVPVGATLSYASANTAATFATTSCSVSSYRTGATRGAEFFTPPPGAASQGVTWKIPPDPTPED
jgi:uncharacterized protein YegL